MDAEKYLTTDEKALCKEMNLTADEYLVAKRDAREAEAAEEIAAANAAKAAQSVEG